MKQTPLDNKEMMSRNDTPDEINEETESRIAEEDSRPSLHLSLEKLKNPENDALGESQVERLHKSNHNAFEKFENENLSEPKRLYLKTELELEQESGSKGIKGKLRKLQLKIKALSIKIYSNFKFQFLINIITVYVLFADYFRVMFFDNRADIYFDVLTIICIFVFVIELLVYLIADSKYFLSFYFFLDVLATVFLVFDITSIANRMFYSQNQNSGSEIAIRIGKIVRIIRLIRILKLFKNKSAGGFKNFKKIIDRKTPTGARQQESKVTKILKESNMKKLIILILSMMVFIPLLDADIYLNSAQYGREDTLHFANFNFQSGTEKELDDSLNQLETRLKYYNTELARYEAFNTIFYEIDDIQYIRPEEIVRVTKEEQKNGKQELIISTRYENQLQGMLDLFSTIFVCIIMIVSINSLNKDVSYLVLNPLERMITKIKQVSIDPLEALKKPLSVQDNKDEMNETLLIERAINKISELLVLGFGQAGSKIITHFLFDPDKDFDQIIPGEKMNAIFGFCDIRNFADATEVLLEEVMGFVNKIADIVHFSVDKYGGSANKNIGDAFLLVWKFVEEDEFENRISGDLKDYVFNRQLAELSLISFIKIVIEINTQPQILEYKMHEGLNARIPGYSVKMGFGLHVGWAIEGAIGSSYKIDASYLSPNVNLASRLEAATKQFGKCILFSGQLFDMFMNKDLISACRHIDTVTVKGSLQPLRLYTVDLNIEGLAALPKVKRYNTRLATIKNSITETISSKFGLESKKVKTIEEYNRKLDQFQITKLKSYEEDGLITKTLEEQNFKHILGLPKASTDNFNTIFAFGVDAYLNGEWNMAKQFIDKCLNIKVDDGPSLVIRNYMQKFNCGRSL